jgi:hypothetical protein
LHTSILVAHPARTSSQRFILVASGNFSEHERYTEKHGLACSYRESVHFFDLAFTHLLGISKNHMIIMGRHLVIISGSIALRDTMTAKAVPGVTEYILLASVRFLDATSMQLRALVLAGCATNIQVCNRAAHCEGINSRQTHKLSTVRLLAAPTRCLQGKRALRVR